MPQVKGTEKRTVTVEVTTPELILGLAESFGVKYPLKCDMENNDVYWKEILSEDNRLVKLVEMKDISYHGSPQFTETGEEITDKYKLAAYDALKTLLLIYSKEGE